MGVFTLHASNIKGFAFEFARASSVDWASRCISFAKNAKNERQSHLYISHAGAGGGVVCDNDNGWATTHTRRSAESRGAKDHNCGTNQRKGVIALEQTSKIWEQTTGRKPQKRFVQGVAKHPQNIRPTQNATNILIKSNMAPNKG